MSGTGAAAAPPAAGTANNAAPAGITAAAAKPSAAAAAPAAALPPSVLYADASRRDLAPGAHRRRVLAVAWGAGGRRLASAGADASVRLWTIDPRASNSSSSARGGIGGGERPDAELRGHGEAVTSVAFAPGRDDLLASCGGRAVRVWDARSQRSVATIPLPAPSGGSEAAAAATATHLSWSPDGSQIAVALSGGGNGAASKAGCVALVDARRLRVARSFPLRSPAGGLTFALHSSSQPQQQQQQGQQGQQQQQRAAANGAGASASAAAATPGGGSAAGAAAAGGGASGSAAAAAAAPENGGAGGGGSSSGNADRLLVGSAWGDLDALAVPSGELIGSARGHCDSALCLAQCGGDGASGGLVATGGADGVVAVFDARAGAPLASLAMFDAPVRALSLSADGKLAAVGGQTGVLEICALDGVGGNAAGSGGGKPSVLHAIPLQRAAGGGGGGGGGDCCTAVAFNPRYPGVLAFGDEARDGTGVVSVVVFSRGGGGGGGGGAGGVGPAAHASAPLRALGGGGGGGHVAAHRPPSSGAGGMGGRPLPPAYPSTAVRGGGGGW